MHWIMMVFILLIQRGEMVEYSKTEVFIVHWCLLIQKVALVSILVVMVSMSRQRILMHVNLVPMTL